MLFVSTGKFWVPRFSYFHKISLSLTHTHTYTHTHCSVLLDIITLKHDRNAWTLNSDKKWLRHCNELQECLRHAVNDRAHLSQPHTHAILLIQDMYCLNPFQSHYFHCYDVVRPCLCRNVLTNRYIIHPPDDTSVNTKHQWNNNDRGKPNDSDEHFVQYKLHIECPGSEPGPLWWKTNN
jgi:hypothetical protein